jgi:hypothetical protein
MNNSSSEGAAPTGGGFISKELQERAERAARERKQNRPESAPPPKEKQPKANEAPAKKSG